MVVSAILEVVLALLLPSTFLAACCTLGAVLLGLGVAGFAAMFLLPVDLWLLRPLENRFPAPSAPAHVDGVILLGGAIAAATSADRDMPILNRDADRLVAFAMLADRYPGARLVFAGGPPMPASGALTEAEATRTLLERLDVQQGRILMDDQSRTTWENAVNTLALARPQPGETWLLITSASHMPRAVEAFRGASWPPVLPWTVAYRTTRQGWPAPFQPVGTRLSSVDLAAHEWLGLAAYRMAGTAGRLDPAPPSDRAIAPSSADRAGNGRKALESPVSQSISVP
jgi:uncharacterized SAM-binding protein YcdF (DUF218 family)